jgi:hypothetical protein
MRQHAHVARCLGSPDAAALRAQYNLPFYLQYLAKWPEYFLFAEGPGGACQGYSACTWRGAARAANARFSRHARVRCADACALSPLSRAQLWARRRGWARAGTAT